MRCDEKQRDIEWCKPSSKIDFTFMESHYVLRLSNLNACMYLSNIYVNALSIHTANYLYLINYCRVLLFTEEWNCANRTTRLS